MFAWGNYFRDEYQYALKSVSYSKIDEILNDNTKFFIEDNIECKVIDDKLIITFTRSIGFEPSALYNLSVSFEVILTFLEHCKQKELGLDWEEVFSEHCDNPYLMNVIPRTSNLIANITSSYGQSPAITPPSLLK